VLIAGNRIGSKTTSLGFLLAGEVTPELRLSAASFSWEFPRFPYIELWRNKI